MPPWDEAAELAALGAVLLAPHALAEVCAIADPADFYRPAHEQILRAAIEIAAAGAAPDAISVGRLLHERGQLERLGGAPFLHTLIASVPTAANAAFYAETVAAKAVLRRTERAGVRLQQLAHDPAADPDQVAATARAELELLADRARVGRCGPTPADVLADEAVERYGDPNIAPRLSTGWPDLDDVLGGGLVPGSVTVLAARPNVGKSVTGLGMAINAASAGHGVMAVTLEMSAAELTDRLIASLGSVTLDTLAARQFDDDQWARVVAGYDRLRELPLWIVDDPGLTVAAIGSAARDCARRPGGLGLIVIDYLQLVTPAERVPRQEQVAGMSRAVKLLAKETGVPTLLLAQLNRGPEQRSDRRPTPADIRESGAVEQDADVVLLLHGDPEAPGEIEVIVAKNRHGRKGSAHLAFAGHYARLSSLARFTGHDATSGVAA